MPATDNIDIKVRLQTWIDRRSFLRRVHGMLLPSMHDIPPPWLFPDSTWQMERHLTSHDDAQDNFTSSTADLDD